MDRLALRDTPFPFGLSFVPVDTLGPVIGASYGPVPDLLEACATLSASFAFVPSDAGWSEAAAAALAAADVAPMWAVSGPLWPVIEQRGALEGLRETLTRPEEVGARIDALLDAKVAEVTRGADAGARAVVVAEDLAGTDGPLVAPDFAIAELLPRYARIVDEARSFGVPAVFHSDGDIRTLLPAIARAGFVAVHAGGGLGIDSFERLFWSAREEGLAVIGGLLTTELVNAVRAEAIGSRIGVLARAGGLLVADDGGITTPLEMAALVTALAAARDV